MVLACIGRLVDPAALPACGGGRASYMEFVAIGIVLSLVVGLLLVRVATALRGEQTRGTLVALATTPSRMGTVQLRQRGARPVLGAAADGVLPDRGDAGARARLRHRRVPTAAVLVVAILPFICGLGLLSAAAILTGLARANRPGQPDVTGSRGHAELDAGRGRLRRSLAVTHERRHGAFAL